MKFTESYQFVSIRVNVARSIQLRGLQRSATAITWSNCSVNLQWLVFPPLDLLLKLSRHPFSSLLRLLVFDEQVSSGRRSCTDTFGLCFGPECPMSGVRLCRLAQDAGGRLPPNYNTFWARLCQALRKRKRGEKGREVFGRHRRRDQ